MLPWGTCDFKVPKEPFKDQSFGGCDNASFKGAFITKKLIPHIGNRSLETPEFWVPSQFSHVSICQFLRPGLWSLEGLLSPLSR